MRIEPTELLYGVAWFIGLYAFAIMIPDLVISFLNLQDYRLGIRMMFSVSVLLVAFGKLLQPVLGGNE